MSQTLSKSLGSLHLWGIIVGMVISGMYFGWNYGLQYTSPLGMAVAVGIVTVFYTTFMFSYAELATAIPHAGGPMAFAGRAFGPFGGFVAGFACLIEYLFATPAIALSLGAYLHFLQPAVPVVAWAVGCYVLFVAVNCLGVHVAAAVELVVTLVAIAGLVFFAAVGVPHVRAEHLFAASEGSGWAGVFAAVPFAIWFYLAVEGGAMAAEEVRNPRRDVVRGFLLGILTLVVLAVVTLLVTAGLAPVSRLGSVDAPLPAALAAVYGDGHLFARIVSVVGLFGLVASLHGIIIGYSRQAFAMAREGYLPAFLSYVTPGRKTPLWAILVPSLAGLGFVLTGATATIIVLSVFGAIVLYLLSLASLFVLRRREPALARPFRVAPLAVPVVALVLAVFFLVAVGYANRAALGWVVAAFGAAVLLYVASRVLGPRAHAPVP